MGERGLLSGYRGVRGGHCAGSGSRKATTALAVAGRRTGRGWECDGLPFFAGVKDCCINAGILLIGGHLGVDVDPVVQRLLADQMPDGGGTAGPRPARRRRLSHAPWT